MRTRARAFAFVAIVGVACGAAEEPTSDGTTLKSAALASSGAASSSTAPTDSSAAGSGVTTSLAGSAAASVAPAASSLATALATPDSAAPAASSDGPSTIGDQTCARDDDCALTRRSECCDCCEGPVLATSKAWLRWRDGTCKRTRCEPCGKVKCRFFPPAEAFVARCERGLCQRAPR